MNIIKRAKVSDYRNFKAERCSNDGCYGFGQTYTLANEERLRLGLDAEPKYRVKYWTTADFDYCEDCGSFGSCGCDSIPQILSLYDVIESLVFANAHYSKDFYGKIEEEVQIDLAPPEEYKKIRRRCEDALRKTDMATLFEVAKKLKVSLI